MGDQYMQLNLDIVLIKMDMLHLTQKKTNHL